MERPPSSTVIGRHVLPSAPSAVPDDGALARLGRTFTASLAVGTADHPDRAASVTVGTGDVVAIRSTLDGLTASDRQFGGGSCAALGTEYLRTVVLPRLGGQATDPVRAELFEVATELALRVAAICVDAGLDAAARRLLTLALGLARETEDVTLHAWAMARHGEQEIQERNAELAIAYTGAAVALAHTAPPATRASILAKHALALSLTANVAATRQVLGEARDAMDRAGQRGEPPWMGNYGWGHILHEQGRCLANLGLGADAAAIAEEALGVTDRARYARPRAYTSRVRAVGYAQAGEVEKACEIGHGLVTVTATMASRRLRDGLAELLAALDDHRAVPAVVDLHEAARPVLAGAAR